MSETKYIFVTGGVASSLGKSIISASLGKLLQARGYRVTIQKFVSMKSSSLVAAACLPRPPRRCA